MFEDDDLMIKNEFDRRLLAGALGQNCYKDLPEVEEELIN